MVVCGPTASGKTGLGVALARRLNGEVVSADSMQIYKGLSVGTAKVTPAEAAGVPHHLVDIAAPQQAFSVADYVAAAGQAITDIHARGRLPVVVGGTGLYISSLLAGVQFVQTPPTQDIRAQLAAEAEALGGEAMWRQLQTVDPEAAAAIHPNNTKRVLRALEVYRASGSTITAAAAQSLPAAPPYDAFIIGLRFAQRQTLYQHIDARVDGMLAAGLLAEARYVYDNRDDFHTASQAIGYKELFPYFAGEATLETCVEALKQASRRYAKRQMTWFGRMQAVHWLTVDQTPDLPAAALALLAAAGFDTDTEKGCGHEEKA